MILLLLFWKGNGKMRVLLDLSAVFDTIDHVILFDILVNYVGLRGKALDLIKSYFLDRTQCVQFEGILCEFAKIVCGVPQGSVLGPLKFCLYMIPLSVILKFHKIGYHVYMLTTLKSMFPSNVTIHCKL